MNNAEEIRSALRLCGEPMTMDQLAEANNWLPDDRKQAHKNISHMRERGEIKTSMAEGRVHYDLVKGYSPKSAGKIVKPRKATSETKTPVAETIAPKAETKPAAAETPLPQKTFPHVAREIADTVSPGVSLFRGPKPPRTDFDLRKRIDAICTDLADAVSDAIDADYEKKFIKLLLAASLAAHEAARHQPQPRI